MWSARTWQEAEAILAGVTGELVEPEGTREQIVERASAAARELVGLGASAAIVSIGSHGAVMSDGSETVFCAAPQVTVVNPIGGGDSLLGGLAHALEAGGAWPQAAAFAVATASASCEQLLAGGVDPARVRELAAQVVPRATDNRRRARREDLEMKSKPNIRDVARLAGVSTKTVSRVTNDEGTVAAQTRQRVLAAIAELGYSANPMARSLRTGSDEAIALVVTTIADPFIASVVDAVERAAREQGLFLLVACSGDDPANERTVIAGMLNRSVSGLLIVPQNLGLRPGRPATGSGGAPVVFLDRPPRGMHGDIVMIDNAAIAEAATRHLIGYGHERIAFVGVGSKDYTVSARLSGTATRWSRTGSSTTRASCAPTQSTSAWTTSCSSTCSSARTRRPRCWAPTPSPRSG